VPASRIAHALPGDREGGPLAQERLLRRAEVRDVLAWVRLLVDPQDAAAVVRALARAPIELRQAHLARVIALARRRKLDLVAGCVAAIDSPQIPPEARERIERFIALHAQAQDALRSGGADAFVGALIHSLSAPREPLLAPAQAERERAGLRRLENLAHDFVRREPSVSATELARQLAAIAIDASPPSAHDPDAHAPATEGDRLLESFELLREEVLESVARIGARLSELRLDTELDVAHGVVRYLELIKLAAVLQRSEERDLRETLDDINSRLLAATTPIEREILLTSSLDELLLGADTGRDARTAGTGEGADASEGAEAAAGYSGVAAEGDEDASDGDDARAGLPARAVRRHSRGVGRLGLGGAEELSLGPFLPRKGRGLALSASDIHTYLSCPLRYKFARVLRIPTEQTLHQRFGIVVHQVLERYHANGHDSLDDLLALFDAGWRRGGLGDSEAEHALREKGREALCGYHARLQREPGAPVWFERSFNFRLGPHHVRGRVDRVDRILDGDRETFELIDYKTSRPKTEAQLREDTQLSLYALAAREDWKLDSVQLAYHYVLDDRKVAVPADARGADALERTVLEIGEGILEQRFHATPSRAVCAMCDYRITCPVAES
jgi:RecB family exonuclease